MNTVIIGVDPSLNNCGVAIYNLDKKQYEVKTMSLADFIYLLFYPRIVVPAETSVFFIVEDARKRNWFGKNSKQKLQGAGSIKGTCKTIEDLLKLIKYRYEMVSPLRGGTKLSKELIHEITGYNGKSSEHSRDAIMIVHNYITKKKLI